MYLLLFMSLALLDWHTLPLPAQHVYARVPDANQINMLKAQEGRPANALYRNNGDGTFTDVSQAAGIAAHAGWGMGLVAADYDGDTDVLVANDVAENFLFANDGAGRFEEVALFSGFAYDGFGDEQGSMGVDCGDYNNDGRLDFFMTSYQG